MRQVVVPAVLLSGEEAEPVFLPLRSVPLMMGCGIEAAARMPQCGRGLKRIARAVADVYSVANSPDIFLIIDPGIIFKKKLPQILWGGSVL
ncbi:MAG: hypothetical protein ABI683_10630 [Ginsengibacter sp.]